jgi:hypothetical protein
VDPAPTGPASDSLEDVEETRSENSRKLALAPGVCALAVAHGPSDWIERQVDQVIGVAHRVPPRDLNDPLVAEVLAQLPPKLRRSPKALVDLPSSAFRLCCFISVRAEDENHLQASRHDDV